MFVRFVAESMRRSPRRKIMTIAAVAMGTAVATAVLGVQLDIGDKINLELSSLGANILVTPRARTAAVESAGVRAVPLGSDDFIPEALIPKIKTIFWQLNITGFAPSLSGAARVGEVDVPLRGVWFDHAYRTPDGRDLHTGIRAVNPSWKLNGAWISDSRVAGKCVAGAAIASKLHLKPGSTLDLLGNRFVVSGVLFTGGDEDDQILMPLRELQRLTRRVGEVDAIQVAAITKPEDDFARKDPARMTPKERERWDCTNYVSSIARQIEGVLPMAVARPIRRVADSEGRVLSKVSGLMLLIALAALTAAGLTVWSVMATTMLERRGEIAIMQATGATDRMIASLFGAEVGLEGLLGGAIGVLAGLRMAHWVGRSVFQAGIEIPAILPPLAMGIAVLVAIAGRNPAAPALAVPAARDGIAGAHLVFWAFVSSAMRLRRRRLLLAFSALAVSAALATALFTVYSDIERRISEEFASYGANLVIAPGEGAVTVPIRAVSEARKLGAVAAPFLFAQSKLNGEPVLLAGLERKAAEPLTQYWHVEGTREGCLAGANVAERFHLQVGSEANIAGAACRVSGIVSTGGSEDNELIVPFATAAAVGGAADVASLVEVRVPAERLVRVQRALRERLPGTDVRLVRAVAETESSVVVKMRVALFLLLSLILVITTLSVSSNFSELVLERSREIGILKAIGAAERKIAALFVSESLLLALVSTAAGYLAGILLAGWIAESVFAAPFALHMNFPVLLLAAAITLTVAFIATAIAAGRIWRIQAATILRGE